MCADCPARLAADLDAAYPEFLAHHQDLVYGVALRSTKRPSDAEDLAQEAFIRAYRALADYAPGRVRELHSRGWLVSIVMNLARNQARRRRPAPADLEAVVEPVAEPGAQPERIVARRETADEWQRRLDALPPRYGQAVALRHVDGLSYPELAEALGRPIGTVKSDVHRGVKLLRAAIADEAGVGVQEAVA